MAGGQDEAQLFGGVHGTVTREQAAAPGWRFMAGFRPACPFLENVLFLEGMDYSSNMYAISGDYLSIVDPANDYTAFIQLFAMGFVPADIRKVAITHGHIDHAMGAVELLQAYPSLRGNLEIIMHEAGPAELKELLTELGGRLSLVSGGEVVDLSGVPFRVLPTPGHTADGICFYHEESGTLLSGDTVLAYAVSAPDQAAGGSLPDYLGSLRLIMGYPVGPVLTGHDDPAFGREVVAATYEGVVKRMMGPRVSWNTAAMQFVQWGSIGDALYCCERWLEENAGDEGMLELKGMCLNDLGRFKEAGEFFRGRPRSSSALVGLGYALMGLSRFDESLAALDAALALDPGREEALVYKGLSLYLAGRGDEAMDIGPFQSALADRVKRELLLKVQGGEAVR